LNVKRNYDAFYSPATKPEERLLYLRTSFAVQRYIFFRIYPDFSK
jgi:hypothetical protein